MKGQNEVARRMQEADGSLVVNSIYPTIQGEGPDAGRSAIFIRLTHCNLRCFWCDTNFETGSRYELEDVKRILARLLKRKKYLATDLAVITGGEPLLQNILPITRWLNDRRGVSVAVETAGTVYLEGLNARFVPDRRIGGNLVVVSPKTVKLNSRVVLCTGAIKYIGRAGELGDDDGLPVYATQIGLEGKHQRLWRPEGLNLPIYLQPADEEDPEKNRENAEACVGSCMRFGHRLSLQQHKFIGLP